MKVPSSEHRSGVLSLRVALTLVSAGLIPLLAFAAGPAWWSQRGVFTEGATANDYAPANQGQLKNLARAAVLEMDAQLPGGAGGALHALIGGWSPPSVQTNDFAALNIGQLKNIAKPFYDRLIAIGLANSYPWANSSHLPDDFALANVGQLKKLFAFDFSSVAFDGDGNGFADAWERQYFGHLGVDPNADPDGDGATNLQEYQRGTDPTHADEAPSLRLSPDQLSVVVARGQTHSEILTLNNATFEAASFYITPRNNQSDGSFADSDHAAGPAYQWEDISSTGTLLEGVSNADDGFENFDLGFAFPYFGQSFTAVFVGSNGYVTFGEGSDQYSNYQLPSSDMPANEIAAFHADLNPGAFGDIYYLNEEGRTIIQYQNVARYDGNGYVTFQIVLESNGAIEIRYKDLPAIADDVTVGLQNATRDRGLTIAHRQAYLHPNLAVRTSSSTAWLTVSPTSGVVDPSQARPIMVTFDATYLASGSYGDTIELSSTPSTAGLAAVPVTMIVNEAPTVSLIAPTAGSIFLSSTSVILSADAADLDGTIAKVEFYADGQLLGQATSTPFSLNWPAVSAGAHVLVAKAIDDRGTSTLSAPVNINVIEDSDGDTIPDDWELAHFGNLSQTAEGDFDSDGISNEQEYRDGSDPADYFNGARPAIVIVAGDNQRGPAGETMPLPLTVRITNEQGAPLPNAPVHFRVATGDGAIVLGTGGAGFVAHVQANVAGEAAVFARAPETRGSRSTFVADCGTGDQTASVTFGERAEAFLQVTPDSLAFALNQPESGSKTVVVSNSGPIALDFSCESKGPFYRFQDSTVPDGPLYQWDDISSTGALLSTVSGSDDDFEAVDLPFNFPFFGQEFSRIFVGSNGFVTVGAGSPSLLSSFLPGTEMPPGVIAAFQTDLNPSAGGHIYYLNQPARAVIQFDQVPHYDGTGPVTFQIVLEQTGAITVLYKSMVGTLNAATVGVQNLLQDQGVEVASNKPYVKDGLAVRFTRDYSWLHATPASGQLEPGQSVEIAVTADSASLFNGNYEGLLNVRSIAEGSALEVPVTATVNSGPVVELILPVPNLGIALGQSISVEALAHDRNGQIARVEFFEGSNPIGTAAHEPYSRAWQPPHAGLFSLTARAVDNFGATSVSLPRSVQVEEDSDHDGLGDQWEMTNFHNLDQTPDGDYDGDGRTNLQEFHDRTAGDDYYNGGTPYPDLLSRTRAASKSKRGFHTYISTTPPAYYLQEENVTSLVPDTGNPESEVGGAITQQIDPDTGGVTETERTGRPLPFLYGSLDWDPNPTATTRVDYLTIFYSPEWEGTTGAYDDPPNLVQDLQATGRRALTLSDEYTTEQLISRTRNALEPVPPFDAPWNPVKDDATFADFEFLSPPADQSGIYLSHSKYQFKWHPSPNLPAQKKITWLETFTPIDDPRTPNAEDTTPITTVRTWEGTANETEIYYLSPTRPGRYGITTLPGELMVDGNRDGEMSFTDGAVHSKDTTSEARPYRFWINDDDDTEVEHPSEDGPPIGPAETETVPALRADSSLHRIASKRNLEDFSRLWINLRGLQDEVQAGRIQIGLKWKTSETPAINIFPSEDWKGSKAYLKDEDAAARQITGVYNNAVSDKNNNQTVAVGGAFVFKADFWTGLTPDDPKKCLLFEGVQEGKGELAIVFFDRNGNQLTEGGSVWLEFKEVRKLYERGKVAIDAPDIPEPSQNDNPAPLQWIWDPWNWQPEVDPNAEAKTIVYVHGWRMTYDEYISWADTTFKRLHQIGYKGRFYSFHWPTFNGDNNGLNPLDLYIPGGATYNRSEYRAWLSGPALADFINNLPNPTARYLLAHSMGNVTAGAALRTGLQLTRYAMCNSAMAAMAYDASITDNNFSTPDTDVDSATRETFGLANKLNPVQTQIVNFVLPADYALGQWSVNNELFKPQPYIGHNYYYHSYQVPGRKLTYEGLITVRGITSVPEAMGYVTQSRSRAAGIKPTTRGSVKSLVDMDSAGFAFGTEHSAEWVYSFQKTHLFWRRVAEEFRIDSAD